LKVHIKGLLSWSHLILLFTVADVPDAEVQFHAHEFLDATVQPKPIYISPNEIYTMHGLLSQYQNHLVRSSYFNRQRLLTIVQALDHDDALKTILAELDGVPNLGTEELKDARDTAITLELTNRFAHVRGQLDSA
jgi:Ras GTPase-activating-like protein IQGAP2/3